MVNACILNNKFSEVIKNGQGKLAVTVNLKLRVLYERCVPEMLC